MAVGQRVEAYEQHLLTDLEYLYWRSYEELELAFNNQFKASGVFKDMVLLLNQNMIEFMFLKQAGVIRN